MNIITHQKIKATHENAALYPHKYNFYEKRSFCNKFVRKCTGKCYGNS